MEIQKIISDLEKLSRIFSDKIEMLKSIASENNVSTEIKEIGKKEEAVNVILFALSETPQGVNYTLCDIAINSKPYINSKIKEFNAQKYNVVYKIFSNNSSTTKQELYKLFNLEKRNGKLSISLNDISEKMVNQI